MRIGRWMLTLLVLVVGVGVAYKPPADASAQTAERSGAGDSLTDRAQAQRRAGDYAGACRTLRRALAFDPASTEIASLIRDVHKEGRLEPSVDEDAVGGLLDQLGTGFRRTETARFVVLSDATTKWTRTRERLLERTYHEVMKFAQRIGLPAVPPEHKLVVVLFREHARYRDFALTHDGVEATWVAGYYASAPNHAVFYDDRTSPAFQDARAQLDRVQREAKDARLASAGHHHPSPEAMAARADALDEHAKTQRARLDEQAQNASIAKTTHEATHLIAFNTNIQLRSRHYPFWITEGLAIAFETADPSKPFGPNVEDEPREAMFAGLVEDDAIVPLEVFVQRTEVHGHDASDIRDEYTQAWGLFCDAARYRKDELVGLLADIARSPAGRMSAQTHGAMFAHRFGDPERHQRAWLRRR